MDQKPFDVNQQHFRSLERIRTNTLCLGCGQPYGAHIENNGGHWCPPRNCNRCNGVGLEPGSSTAPCVACTVRFAVESD